MAHSGPVLLCVRDIQVLRCRRRARVAVLSRLATVPSAARATPRSGRTGRTHLVQIAVKDPIVVFCSHAERLHHPHGAPCSSGAALSREARRRLAHSPPPAHSAPAGRLAAAAGPAAAGARPPSTRAAGRHAAANSRRGRAHIQ